MYVYIAEQVHLDLFGCSDIITDICLVCQAMYCSLVWSISQGLGQLHWITPSHPPTLLQCVLMGMLSTMLMVLMYKAFILKQPHFKIGYYSNRSENIVAAILIQNGYSIVQNGIVQEDTTQVTIVRHECY